MSDSPSLIVSASGSTSVERKPKRLETRIGVQITKNEKVPCSVTVFLKLATDDRSNRTNVTARQWNDLLWENVMSLEQRRRRDGIPTS